MCSRMRRAATAASGGGGQVGERRELSEIFFGRRIDGV